MNEPASRRERKISKTPYSFGALAVHDYEQSLKEQVIASSAAYRATLAETVAMSESVSSAEEAYRLAQERYAVGKGTQTDVLASLTRLTLARDSQADTLNQRDMAAQRLLRFAGNEKDSLAAFTSPAEPALPEAALPKPALPKPALTEPALVPLVPEKPSASVVTEATVIPPAPVALTVAPLPKSTQSVAIAQPPKVAPMPVPAQAPVTAAVVTPPIVTAPVPVIPATAPVLPTLTATSAPTHVPWVGFVLIKTPPVTKVAGSQEERRSPSHAPVKDQTQHSSPGSSSIHQTPKP